MVMVVVMGGPSCPLPPPRCIVVLLFLLCLAAVPAATAAAAAVAQSSPVLLVPRTERLAAKGEVVIVNDRGVYPCMGASGVVHIHVHFTGVRVDGLEVGDEVVRHV